MVHSSALRTALLLLLVAVSQAFYLPGVAPQDYKRGWQVELKVNKLDSVKTQLPYDYYSLPFCRPEKIEDSAENLGEILSGDVIQTSPYEIFMDTIEACKILCRMEYTDDQLAEFAQRVEEDYRVNWIVDSLPAVTKYFTSSEPDDNGNTDFVAHFEKGFALGFVGEGSPNTEPGVPYLNNHVRLTLMYHKPNVAVPVEEHLYRVVGFEVEPFSVKHEVTNYDEKTRRGQLKTCSSLNQVIQSDVPQSLKPTGGAKTAIFWTYDVDWKESEVKWASRWDAYLKMTDSQIHWFSIVNSIIIVLFLTGMIAMIMLRTLHRDFVRYNQLEETDEELDESGWKLIYGDVFRPPQHGGALAVLVGTGVQVFSMTLITLVFAVLGFLSPANRGGLMSALLLLFVFMGVFAGYFSTRTYKMFKLQDWKLNTFFTAIFFPGVCFSVFFILNLFVWGQKSSGAVPFGTLVALLVLWFGISVPLVYAGSYLAVKKPPIEPPVSVNHIPRTVPDQPWYLQPVFSVMVGGILPFGAVFIEIFFIMSSIWLHQFYYVFGVLFIVFVILIITCAEISIVMCYFQLCGEDHHWWWRSYLCAGSSAVYLFLYSFLYFFSKLNIVKFVSALLFFGYMFLISFAFFVLTGSIGYFASYMFVRKIYSSIHLD